MKLPLPVLLLLCATFLHVSELSARKNARVITDAWASPEFVEKRMTENGPLPMTYHFIQGQFHSGNIKDKSLKNLSLQDIGETLAEEMEKQNFFPASDLNSGDLMIAIHWGVTEVELDYDEMFPTSESDLPEGENGEDTDSELLDENAAFSTTVGRKSNKAKNATITGIRKGFNNLGNLPSDRLELEELLDEERYFIVLMAFDWHLLRTQKERKLLWTTRFSLPSPGTNFMEAVPTLTRAAVPHIGTNLDELITTKTHLGSGTVEIGDLKVIEVSESEEK